MQQHQDQIKQIKDILNNKQIRYRKLTFNGTTVVAQSNPNNYKVISRQLLFQYPHQITHQEISPLTVKVIQEDYYKNRSKYQGGIKSLLRVYDEAKKKNYQQLSAQLGLDIIKVKSFSNNKKNDFNNRTEYKSLKKVQQKYSDKKTKLTPINYDQTFQAEKYQNINNLMQMSATSCCFSEKQLINKKISPKKSIKRQRRVEDYLYKRLEGTENKTYQQQNSIYQKRIKSYIQFLWKISYAHNVSIPLQLKGNQGQKHKAYIALGNNGAMVRSILKRRYWWVLTEERTNDCQFIWTQLKINEIFQKQKKSLYKKYKRIQYDSDDQQRGKLKKQNFIDKNKKKIIEQQRNNNKVVMHQKDALLYQQYWKNFELNRQRDIKFKIQNIKKQLVLVNQQCIIHNHFQCNYFLGNKKALFHNLKQYCMLTGKQIFDYVPLTFHIRKGTKDIQYIKFVDYYKKRAKQIEKDKKKQEQQGIVGSKARNIWIVKPGQNSNQGRGITVIDQIYQLNSIIKQSRAGQNQQNQKTFIVQLYLDKPLLYNNRKFDIRHYMLITNIYGVFKAYWYADGYIRTSSYQFDIQNFQQQIHLTNDAVQKRYQQYHRYQPYNKISYEQFQKYIQSSCKSKINFRQQILPIMKSMATDAVRSVYTKLSPRNLQNNFQIFGLDFMLDRNFKPWLIQINTNPCLECNSPLLNKIIPYMVQQSFKLSLDIIHPPPNHYPNSSKHLVPFVNLQTFKYQLIFDSQFDGQQLTNIYKKNKSNILQKIGIIEDDQQFKDEGNQCKLDDIM